MTDRFCGNSKALPLRWTTAPEFFQQNGTDSWSEVAEKYRIGGNNAEGEAPDNLLGKIQEAADSCPVAIIEVV